MRSQALLSVVLGLAIGAVLGMLVVGGKGLLAGGIMGRSVGYAFHFATGDKNHQ